jgi:hypothetical protein
MFWKGIVVTVFVVLLAGCLGGGGPTQAADTPDTSTQISDTEGTADGQQGNAPSISFEAAESVETLYELPPGDGKPTESVNWTVLRLGHAGGDTLDQSQTEIEISGNSSVWGFNQSLPEKGETPSVTPAPNFLPAVGTGQSVPFAAGEQWQLFAHGGALPDKCEDWKSNSIKNDDYVPKGGYTYFIGKSGVNDCTVKITAKKGGPIGYASQIRSGSTVEVLWTAESGEEAQTLYTYTTE